MAWFKLIGSSEDPIPEYWDKDRPDLLTEIRFPWNRPPSDIYSPGKLIIYAVGAGTLVAIQTVDGPPRIRPRRGSPGTPENRWPHKLAVKTEMVCSPTSTAPDLREVAPEFAQHYKSRFWNGSHWKITSDEYDHLAEIINRAGTKPLPPPI